MIRDLSTDELLDWLAVMEVDPWGPKRDDRRAAVASLWTRGAKFDDVKVDYPHVGDEIDLEDEEEIIALLELDDKKLENATTRTAESTNNG